MNDVARGLVWLDVASPAICPAGKIEKNTFVKVVPSGYTFTVSSTIPYDRTQMVMPTTSSDQANWLGVARQDKTAFGNVVEIILNGVVEVKYTGTAPTLGSPLVLSSSGYVTVGSRSSAVAISLEGGTFGTVRALLVRS
jgi:hypothetical protein